MTTTLAFPTSGMHCQSCARLINMEVSDLPGVESVEVDLSAATTSVTFDDSVVSPEAIRDAITGAGYPAQLPTT